MRSADFLHSFLYSQICKPTYSANAFTLIDSTLHGITILVRFEHSRNARASNDFNVSESSTLYIFSRQIHSFLSAQIPKEPLQYTVPCALCQVLDYCTCLFINRHPFRVKLFNAAHRSFLCNALYHSFILKSL